MPAMLRAVLEAVLGLRGSAPSPGRFGQNQVHFDCVLCWNCRQKVQLSKFAQVNFAFNLSS